MLAKLMLELARLRTTHRELIGAAFSSSFSFSSRQQQQQAQQQQAADG